MILEQVLTHDLGCAAYIIGCDHVEEAIVVDPPLHVQPVLDVCDRYGLRLVGVIETHTHADHVAGHGVLAASHGTWIATHPLGRPAYPFRPIEDGDRIVLGQVSLEVLHTPGHRPEHCCIAVSDLERADDPWILLSGDSLFVGDVARPDLAVGGDEGAEGLYRSLSQASATASRSFRATSPDLPAAARCQPEPRPPSASSGATTGCSPRCPPWSSCGSRTSGSRPSPRR
jgi:glyoxylase-like metal-dependent hydrolase (beta-lactamase superfamily II)